MSDKRSPLGLFETAKILCSLWGYLYNERSPAGVVTAIPGHFTTPDEGAMQSDSTSAREELPELMRLFHRGQRIVGYFVGSDGSVWSQKGGQTIRLKDYPCGKNRKYRGVALRHEGRTLRVNVHSVVAEAWYGPRPEGLQVRHLDGNGHNNAIINLAYGTASENQADKIGHGTHQYGQQNPSAKLTNEQAEEIKMLRIGGMPLKEIAERFGVRESTVSRIASGVRRSVCI